MAASKTISIRLGLEGAAELRSQLESAGNTGGAALAQLRAGLERLNATDTANLVAALERVKATAAAATAATAQAQANSFAGVKDATDYKARSSDIAAYGAELDRLRAKFNPLYAASKQYEAQLSEISAAEKVGAISTTEANAAREAATASFTRLNGPLSTSTAGLNAASASMRGLGIQFIQAASGIASGQPILTTFIQQGHQVVDQSLAMGTGFSGIGAAAKDMLSAVGGLPTLLTAGVVGALTAVAISAENESTRLSTLRQQLRATHDDYATLATTVDAAARQMAASTTLSTAQAQQAAQTLASAKYFSGTQADLQSLIGVSEDLAKVWNIDVGAAAKFLAGAIDDPAKAAQEAAQRDFPGFNAALVQTVSRLQAAGNGGAALALVLGTVQSKTAGAAKDTSPLSTALQGLEKAFYGAEQGGKSLATTLGDFVDLQAARVVHGLENVVNVIKAATSAAEAGLQVTQQAGNAVRQAYPNGIDPETGAPNNITLPSTTSTSSSATSTQVDASIRPLIDAASKQYQVDSEILSRLQLFENAKPTGYDASGNAVYAAAGTSANSAVGPFQVKPSTYSGLGFTGDASDNSNNKNAAAKYFRTLLDKYGDVKVAVLAYHDGETVMDQVLAGQATNSQDALKEARTVTQGYSGTGYATAAGAGTAATSSSQAATVAATGGEAYTLSSQTGSFSTALRDSAKATSDALDAQAASARAFQNLKLDASIAAVTDEMAKEAAAAGTSSDRYKALEQVQQDLRAERYKNVDAETAAQRQAESSLRSTAGMTAAEQSLSAAIEARRQVALQSGQDFGSAQQNEAISNALAAQSQQYERVTFNLANTTAAQKEMVAAYDSGDQAVVDTTAKQAAYNEALQLFPRSSQQFGAAYQTLIGYYKQSASAAAEAQVAQKNLASRDTLVYIAAETSSLGQNEAERSRMLAVMKAEQEMHAKFGKDLPAEAQAYIDLAGKVSDATSAFAHQQAVTSELGSFFDSTFSTISTAITSAFSTGQISAIKFGDIAKSVASSLISEFLKLAAINPLKNWLFGSTNSTVTLSDVIGNIFGGSTTSVGGSITSTSVNAISSLVASNLKADAAAGGAGTLLGTGASSSTVGLGTVGAGVTTLDAGKTALTGVSTLDNLASFITYKITDLIGNTQTAIDIAAQVSATGTNTLAGTLGASIANGLGLSNETAAAFATGAQSIAEALPYVGAAISVITDLAQGNYRGAALTGGGAATGAAIGAIFAPESLGISVAVGAAVGALADALLPSHPLHSYQDTQVNIAGGHVVAGRTVDQVQSSDETVAGINTFGQALDVYMSKVGLILTNTDSILGHVGQGITGLTQVNSVTDPSIFSKLQFANDPSDTSNFGVAKGALYDMRFNSADELNTELAKIAGFADAASAVGITLKSVGKDISNIQIASVSGGNASQTTTIKDAQGNDVTYRSDLRTALNRDLPSQTFADTTALDNEITKVNTFVNSTLPGLLTPIEKTSSTVTEAVDNIRTTYESAISQSEQYGLDNTAVLRTAEDQAIAIIRRTSIMAIQQAQTSYTDRNLIATQGGQAAANKKTMDDLATSATNEIESFSKSWTDTFEDAVKSTTDYQNAIHALSDTLANEATAKAEALQQAFNDTFTGLVGTAESYQARYLRAIGQNEEADLIDADTKAASERQAFIESFTSFFGDAITQNETFQAQLAYVDAAHYQERLAIQQKYETASNTSTSDTLKTAQGQVTSLFTSLKDYAHSLQTGSNSPLSPTAQYALASQQFNAVRGAAASGDHASASELKTYADSLISASRAVFGSGTGYADDVNRVLDAISGVAANPDMLTATAQRDIAREQTAAIVDAVTGLQDQVAALQTELAATRRELQQQTRAIAA